MHASCCPRRLTRSATPLMQVRDGNIEGLCITAISYVTKFVGLADEASSTGGRISDLKLPEYTKAEEGLRKYSAVGQARVCNPLSRCTLR